MADREPIPDQPAASALNGPPPTYGTAIVVLPGGRKETVGLGKPVLRLGRAADNDIVIDSPEVSDYHAQLFCRAGGFEVIDLDSGGGTALDNRRVAGYEPTPLAADSVLQIGPARIFLYPPDDEEARPWPAAPSNGYHPADHAMAGQYGAAVVLDGAGRRQVAPLQRLVIWVGSAADNDIVLEHPDVAAYALQIVCAPGEFVAIDLGSGTRSSVEGALQVAGARILLYRPSELHLLEEPAADPEADAEPEPAADPPQDGQPSDASLPTAMIEEWTAPPVEGDSADEAAAPGGAAVPVEVVITLPPASEANPPAAGDADPPLFDATIYAEAPDAQAAPEPPPEEIPVVVGTAPMVYGTAILRGADGNATTVPLYKPTIRLGRAADNDIVLEQAADYHAQLFCTAGTFQVLDLNSAEGTLVDKRRIQPYATQALADDSVISIGEVNIFLYPTSAALPATPPAIVPAAASAQQAPAEPARTRTIGRVSLAPVHLTLDAGESASATISFVNHSSVLERVNLAVEGLPAEWVSLGEQDVPIFPGARGEVKLTVAPPRDPSSLAGRYPFRVVLRSDHDPEHMLSVDGTLTIRAFTRFSLGVFPRHQTGQRQGLYQVELTNHGNSYQYFDLHCFDEHDAFEPPFTARTVWVKPGMSQKMAIRLRLKTWRWWFGKRRGYNFLVSARSADDQVEQAKAIFIHVPTLAHGTQYPQTQAPPKALPPPTSGSPAEPRALPAPPAVLGRRPRSAPPAQPTAQPAETVRLPAVAETPPASGPTTPLANEGIGYQPAHMALAASSFSVDTGSSVTTTVSVINRSSVVDRINLSVAGIPAGWVSIIPESLPLLPGAQSEAQIIITPPRQPASAAGTSHFRVLGRSDKRPDQQAFATGVLTVRPYTDFKADVFPKERKVRRQGAYQVQVANRSNQPLVFRLEGSNDEEMLDFQFDQPDLTVPAGEVRKTALRVRLRTRRLVGTSQVFPLLVSATPGAQAELTQQAPARIADKPLIPQWLLQTVLMPLALLVIALLMFTFRTDITNFIKNLTGSGPKPTAVASAPAGAGAGAAGVGGASATPTGTLSLAPAAPPQVPITTEVRWTVEDSPIVLRTNQTVPAGTRLTIDPGVEVRFDSRVSLEIKGNLVVNGTRQLPVRFGSADGGSWDGIYVRPGGQANLLGAAIDNAGAKGVTVLASQGVLIIRDTTLTNNRAGVLAFNSYVEIQRTEISGNQVREGALLAISLGAGDTLALVDSVVRNNTLPKDAASAHVLLSGAPDRLEIANNLFDNAGGIGVLLDASAGYSATVTCNTFASSAIGLAVNLRASLTERPAPQVALADNAFVGNGQYGIYSTQALDARNTWWGDPSGPADPSRNKAGSGSAASELVSIEPWSSAAPPCAPAR